VRISKSRNVFNMMISENRVVLSKAELKFLEDLKRDDINQYDNVYLRTLKHRVLKKHKKLTHEALLIIEVLDKLQSL
jgi:hypothetical protein